MSRRAKLRLGSGVLALALLGGIAAWVLLDRGGTRAQEVGAGAKPAIPVLFAPDYATGHDRAGFAGHAMVLVFAEGGLAAWGDFLSSCEADPRLEELLKTRFQGVFVDVNADPETVKLYGSPKSPAVIIKDLRGPILGRIQGEITCETLRGELEATHGQAWTDKSPAYTRLLGGTDLFDELASKDELPEVERLVKLFRHFEADKPEVLAAESKARSLGVATDG